MHADRSSNNGSWTHAGRIEYAAFWTPAGSAAQTRVRADAEGLGALARELDDPALSLEPTYAVACTQLLIEAFVEPAVQRGAAGRRRRCADTADPRRFSNDAAKAPDMTAVDGREDKLAGTGRDRLGGGRFEARIPHPPSSRPERNRREKSRLPRPRKFAR